MDRPVLVTGALGQDGRLLVERLTREGQTVIGVVRPARLPCGGPCPLVGADITDSAAVDRLLAELRPTRIFHLAVVHHSSDGALGPQPSLWRAMTAVNHLATTFLVQAILTHVPDCRLVHAASSHMYRPGETDRFVAEDEACNPPAYYGLTKSWAMDTIRFARERHGLFGGSAILFNHESPYRPESFVSRKISRAAARIRRGSKERLELRNIGARADWFCAEDAVDAMIRMAEAEVPADFIVGSGVATSVGTLLDAAFETVGLDWRNHVDALADTSTPVLLADTRRIGRVLGWAPLRGIRDVIRRMTENDLALQEAGQ